MGHPPGPSPLHPTRGQHSAAPASPWAQTQQCNSGRGKSVDGHPGASLLPRDPVQPQTATCTESGSAWPFEIGFLQPKASGVLPHRCVYR